MMITDGNDNDNDNNIMDGWGKMMIAIYRCIDVNGVV